MNDQNPAPSRLPSRPAVAGLVVAAVVALLLYVASDVLLIGFAGLLLAVFLRVGADAITRWTRLPSGWALLAFILLIIAGFVLVGVFAAPVVADQADQLTQQVPRAFAALRTRLEGQAWSRALLDQVQPERLFSAGKAIAGGAGTALSATFGALGNAAMIFILGLFLAIDPPTYTRGLRALFPPERRDQVDTVLNELDEVLRGWLLAQLGSMAVIGVLTALGLWALGMPLVVALGLLAALLTFIPNLGPILSAVPAVLLALADQPVTAAYVVALYIVVQIIEGNVTTPLIQQHTIAMPPALTIAMQVLLGTLFGLLGLALAVPLTAVGVTLVRRLYVEAYLERRPVRPA
ncbi:MAG: AI-2E family transporter [Janthinobacterium lividum]